MTEDTKELINTALEEISDFACAIFRCCKDITEVNCLMSLANEINAKVDLINGLLDKEE